MIIFGRNTLEEALTAKWNIGEIRVADGSERHLRELIEKARGRGIRVKVVSKFDLDRWTESDSHQGVAALAADPHEWSLEEVLEKSPYNGALLLLDGVEDPRNFGAILRSALASGAKGVVLPRNRAAPMSAAAVKASAGAAFTLPVARVTNMARTVEELKERNYWVFGASTDADKSLYDLDWVDNSAIVLGGEGEGMRSLVKKKCDIIFKIPVRPEVESLNVSVAAGIILFEYRRRKGSG